MTAQQITLQTFREARLSTMAASVSQGNTADQGAAFDRLLRSVVTRADETTRNDRKDDPPKARATANDDRNDDTATTAARDRRDDDLKSPSTSDVSKNDDDPKAASTNDDRDASSSKVTDDGETRTSDAKTSGSAKTSDARRPSKRAADGKNAENEADVNDTGETDKENTAATGNAGDGAPVEASTDDDGKKADADAGAASLVSPDPSVPTAPQARFAAPQVAANLAVKGAETATTPARTTTAPAAPIADSKADGKADEATDEAAPTGAGAAFDELLKAMAPADGSETAPTPKTDARSGASSGTRQGAAKSSDTRDIDASAMRVVVRADASVAIDRRETSKTEAETESKVDAPTREATAQTGNAGGTPAADTARGVREAEGTSGGNGGRTGGDPSSSSRDGSNKSGDPSTAPDAARRVAETAVEATTASATKTEEDVGSVAAPAAVETAGGAATGQDAGSLDGTTTTIGGVATTSATRDGETTAHVATARASRTGTVAVPEQVAANVRANVKSGNDSFTIRLKPQELGTIDIKLEIGKDGRVSASVAADNPRTLEMLMRDQKGLEQALQDAGLQTDAGSLNFSLRGDGNQNGYQETRERLAENRRGWGRGGGSSIDGDDDLLPVSQTARASIRDDGRLDVSV